MPSFAAALGQRLSRCAQLRRLQSFLSPGSRERNDPQREVAPRSLKDPVLALVESNSLNAAIGRAGST